MLNEGRFEEWRKVAEFFRRTYTLPRYRVGNLDAGVEIRALGNDFPSIIEALSIDALLKKHFQEIPFEERNSRSLLGGVEKKRAFFFTPDSLGVLTRKIVSKTLEVYEGQGLIFGARDVLIWMKRTPGANKHQLETYKGLVDEFFASVPKELPHEAKYQRR